MRLVWCLALVLAVSACDTDRRADRASARADDIAPARSDLRIIGSSTVYPFAAKVAQEYRYKTGQNIVVESTGSGGGHKLFCEGAGPEHPDIVNSSRRQKASEYRLCRENGVEGIIEVMIGFDGIVIANALSAPGIDLTLKQIFLAFAREIPIADDICETVPNPYRNWSDIDPQLPDMAIETYGPPPTSGTRDAFVEIAMEGGARLIPCLADLEQADPTAFQLIAQTLREDGHWIDAGENDNAIIQTLINSPTALGVFGYSFLDQNVDRIKASSVDDANPTFENIASGAYPVSRSLYLYLKRQHAETIPGVQAFALEFLSDEASAPAGYLEDIGLVPLDEQTRAQFRRVVMELETYRPG